MKAIQEFFSALRDLLLDLVYMLLYPLAIALTVLSAWMLVKWPLWWLLGANFLFIGTWIFFAALMNMGHVREQLQKQTPPSDLPHGPRQLAPFVLLAGYLMDYLLNCMVFAFILLRIPMEHTVSEALNNYSLTDTWRGRVARYFGVVWINWLDLKSLAEGKQHIEIGK